MRSKGLIVNRKYSKWETQNIEDIVAESKKPNFVGSAVTMYAPACLGPSPR